MAGAGVGFGAMTVENGSDVGRSCGKEVLGRGFGLRRLKWGWGDVGGVVVRA